MTEIVNKGEFIIIFPQGRIDTTTTKAFEADLAKAKGEGCKSAVMSFEKVDYISSAGLRNIVLFAKYVKSQSGKFALCSMNPGIDNVFKSAGFDKILTIVTTLDEAVKFIS